MRRYGLLFLAALCTSPSHVRRTRTFTPTHTACRRLGGRLQLQFHTRHFHSNNLHVRLTVTAVEATQFTVQISNLNAGKDTVHMSATNPLNKPFGHRATIADATPVAQGEEELTIGDRKLRCKWFRYEQKNPATTYTLYTHPEIPITGLARI